MAVQVNIRVLVACEYSATVRDAFRARGFDAREIEGFPGYVVTACGKVFSRNHPTGPLGYYKQLSGRVDRKGYRGLTLCNADGHFPKRVHRLVAGAFHPNPDGLPCVRHKNGTPGDNRADNLAWATYAENEADKRVHGTWDTRRNGKLDEAQIAAARKWAGEGMARKAIALELGVSPPTISRLLNGRTWGNVPCAS